MYLYLYCSARTKQLADDAASICRSLRRGANFSITASPYLHSSPICALHPHIRISRSIPLLHPSSCHVSRVVQPVLFVSSKVHAQGCLLDFRRSQNIVSCKRCCLLHSNDLSPHYVHPASRFPLPASPCTSALSLAILPLLNNTVKALASLLSFHPMFCCADICDSGRSHHISWGEYMRSLYENLTPHQFRG